MGFDYDPYKHIELVQDDNGFWGWYCHNCGAESKDYLAQDVPLYVLISQWIMHIKISHRREPEDFEGWSKF